jgi:hypothetical protein
MKTILLLAACAAALTGCAGIQTAVRANAAHEFGTGARTYALASDAAGASGSENAPYVSAVERRLGELGFAPAPAATARYRVALSHETRPAFVGIAYPGCGQVACEAAVLPPGLEWPGAKYYLHSLTVRFFDCADGREAYKVSATKRDRDADGSSHIDELVASAFARLPFASAGERLDQRDWKVTLRRSESDAAPRVAAIVPLQP